MSTALVHGNGKMLVNIDDKLNISDLYWPHVGEENHLAKAPNEQMIRVNGSHSYLSEPGWDFDISYQKDTLVSLSHARNAGLGVDLSFHDCVTPEHDIFIRDITFHNTTDHEQEIFFYVKSNFYMLEDDIGNTAVWYEPARLMTHYKKNRYLGVGSCADIYQFSCAGPADHHGRGCVPEDDGELPFNPITTGSAQSCISFKFKLAAGDKRKVDYFVICGASYTELAKLSEHVRQTCAPHLLSSTAEYWQNWIEAKTKYALQNIVLPAEFADSQFRNLLIDNYKRSLLIIRTQIDYDGAILAANDATHIKAGGKDNYSYCWPRDAAITCLALTNAGFDDLCKRFFTFMSDQIGPEGFLLHKYYPNPAHGLASSWHSWIDEQGRGQLPIQEDETALVIYALYKHYQRFSDQEFIQDMWQKLVLPAAKFMSSYRYNEKTELQKPSALDDLLAGSGIPRPSYDIWEIDRGVSTYTVATVYAGMLAAANLAESLGERKYAQEFTTVAEEIKTATIAKLVDPSTDKFYTRLSLKHEQVYADVSADSALMALWKFGMLASSDARIVALVSDLEERLWVPTAIGGLARKENDTYQRIDSSLPGNPWIISTLWLAQYYLATKNYAKAKKYLEWVLARTDYTGLMAEQADPHYGVGVSIKPLTMSHAEFVLTVNMMMVL